MNLGLRFKSSCNLFLCLAILFLIILNTVYINSSILGCILLLTYLIFFGYIAGKIFFEEENFSLLIGSFLVISWLTVWEGIIALFKKFMLPWILLPIIFFPIFLFPFQLRKKNIIFTSHFYIRFPSFTFLRGWKCKIIFVLLIFTYAISLYLLFLSRTGSMIFSANEVLPIHFWFSFTVTLLLFTYLCRLVGRKGASFLLIISFLISFQIFGITYVTYKYSFGADLLGWVSNLRVLINAGGCGRRIVFGEMGFYGLVGSIIAIMTTQPSTQLIYTILRMITPLLASIYIPLFTYKILRIFFPLERIFYLGVFSFIFFPLSWQLGIPVGMSIGYIFLFSLLYLLIRLFNSSEYKLFYAWVPIILTLSAILLLHQIVALYALLAVLSTFFFRMPQVKSGRCRVIATISFSLLFSIVVIPLVFTDVVAKLVPSFIAWPGPTSTFSIPSLNEIIDFFFPQIYPLDRMIIEERYNWFRYLFFIAGLWFLMKNKKFFSQGKIDAGRWLTLLVVNIWLSWFVLMACLENFPYGSHRFASILDLTLIPFAGVALYRICEKCFHLSIAVSIRGWKFKTRFPSIIIIVLLTSLGVCSTYTSFLSPIFPKDGIPAVPGRPIWRAVSEAEVNAVNYINESSYGMRYVVVTDGFLKKLVIGMLGYEVYPELDEKYPGLGLWSVETRYFSDMLNNPSRGIMFNFMGLANVSVGYYVVGDYYIKRRYGDGEGYFEYVESLKRISDSWTVFTDKRYNYNVYVFKFNYYMIFPIDTQLEGFRQMIVYDGQPDFWSIEAWGKGKGKVDKLYCSLGENNTLKIVINSGDYYGTGLTHNFAIEDWSNQDYLYLAVYGTGSYSPIWIDLDCPDHDSYFRYELIDNFIGWRQILISLNKPTEVIERAGSPEFSQVKKIWICFRAPGIYYLGRVILLSSSSFK